MPRYVGKKYFQLSINIFLFHIFFLEHSIDPNMSTAASKCYQDMGDTQTYSWVDGDDFILTESFLPHLALEHGVLWGTAGSWSRNSGCCLRCCKLWNPNLQVIQVIFHARHPTNPSSRTRARLPTRNQRGPRSMTRQLPLPSLSFPGGGLDHDGIALRHLKTVRSYEQRLLWRIPA